MTFIGDSGLKKYRISRLSILLLCSLFALSTTSCGRVAGTIKSLQFCFKADKDVEYLKNLLQTIALEEQMEYSDQSGISYDSLVRMNANEISGTLRNKYIMVFVTGEHGLGFSATNLGAEDQAIINIGGGRELEAAVALADRVEALVKRDWKIHKIEGHQTNYPLNCAAQ
jgi:hypothetical protein